MFLKVWPSFSFISRSVRGRPESLKAKSQYQTLKENGELGSMMNRARNDDFDFKILQQKKQEAEMKRL